MSKRRHRSSSGHRSSKRKHRSKERSWERSREIRRSQDSESSSQGKLVEAVKEIFAFIKQQNTPNIQEVQTDSLHLLESEGALPGEEHQTDEQTVLENRGGEPVASQEALGSELRVAFADPQEEAEGNLKEGVDSSLARELFGEEHSSTIDSSWDSIILKSTKSEVCLGLKEEVRQNYLAKYEPKGTLSCLGPPQINRELLSALAKRQSVLRRDEHQVKSQSQVAACLNALGSGITDLLRYHRDQPADAGMRSIIFKLAEGMHLLADHQHCLSLARQAFIKPCLMFVAKTAADSSTVDDWLFGSSFAEEFKSAQACEKAGRELTRPASAPTTTSRPPLQPVSVRQNTSHPTLRKSGNYKAPAQRILTAARQPRATQRQSRPFLPRPRSRSRMRR